MKIYIENELKDILRDLNKVDFFEDLLRKIHTELNLSQFNHSLIFNVQRTNSKNLGKFKPANRSSNIIIYIDEKMSEGEIAFIVAHEMRHCYQHYNNYLFPAISFIRNKSQYLFQIWKRELKVINMSTLKQIEYMNFPWEIDANEYAIGFIERNKYALSTPGNIVTDQINLCKISISANLAYDIKTKPDPKAQFVLEYINGNAFISEVCCLFINNCGFEVSHNEISKIVNNYVERTL